MMKHILIFFVRMYQATPLASHKYCRHDPTCSEYMIQALKEHGVVSGLWLGLKRMSKCRPNGTFGYDPIPKKEDRDEKHI